jgi:hypothetical protein
MQNKTLFVTLLSTALLIVGCGKQPQPKVIKVVEKPKPKKRYVAPKAPKKNIELKEVEDENFSSEYMYPDAKKKETAKVSESTTPVTSESSPAVVSMNNSECIAMIGQEKFDKYSEMYGGASGALKKCKMLKAL